MLHGWRVVHFLVASEILFYFFFFFQLVVASRLSHSQAKHAASSFEACFPGQVYEAEEKK
jgi:hypothetical protein